MILMDNSLNEKKLELNFLGDLFIESGSMGSFSKIIEHVGPIISSRNIT
jgi:hypothetical protein